MKRAMTNPNRRSGVCDLSKLEGGPRKTIVRRV